MMTWTNISNGAVAVGGIPSSTTVTALRDNPGAMAAGENGSPVMIAAWHPYDKVTVGDGQDGLIYDHAVNGNVAEVVTPDFEDGYEYRLLGFNVSHNNGTAAGLTLELYEETSAAYDATATIGTETSGINWRFDIELLMPRLVSGVHWALIRARALNSENSTSVQTSGTAEKILRARIKFTAGSIDSGKIWMLRRAEYLTGF
jgi:hypothetical protein